ncbi:MAG: gluconate 2-dehydrogenase subunit 3 family protein [Verrucomicrobiota bacterium]
MDRREAIKWMLAAAASASLLSSAGHGAEGGPPESMPPGQGYGTDPDLLKIYKPGDVWALTFNDAQRQTAASLCDMIIPADDKGPAASTVRVHEFIDEWISAPYPGHAEDKELIVEGLAWLDTEAQKRFGGDFVNLVLRQKTAICDDICYTAKAAPEFLRAARFFKRYRDLTAGGYYSTPAGMKDIGYVGNVAMEKFEGPPKEVLEKLGLV